LHNRGIRRGVSRGSEDSRTPPVLQGPEVAARRAQNGRVWQALAILWEGSPWLPLEIHPWIDPQ
jgi:hypothetical protein